MKNPKTVLALLTTLFVSSCQGIKWNPDFYAADHVIEGIRSESGHTVYADEEAFDQYACLSDQKIKELKEILRRARMPKEEKLHYLGAIESILRRRK